MQIRCKIIGSIIPILNSLWTVSSTLTFEILIGMFVQTRRSFLEVNDCDAAILLTYCCGNSLCLLFCLISCKKDRARVTSGAAMLSAGLASSNLSWDFSLARRAASLSSLNWSANCRMRKETFAHPSCILELGLHPCFWINVHRGHVLMEACDIHTFSQIRPFRATLRCVCVCVKLPAAAAVQWRSPARTRCWPGCLPTGQTSGRFWWRSCWGWWCCWWWPNDHRDKGVPVQNLSGLGFEKHRPTGGQHPLWPLRSHQTLTFVPPTLMIR